MSSITYPQYALKWAIFANETRFDSEMVTKRHHFVDVNKIVSNVQKMHIAIVGKRNAGQLPQPFWLGVACGGGSCSAACCAART